MHSNIDYSEYLKSSQWQHKRKEKAVAQNYTCEICGKKVLSGYHIHHKTYKNLGSEPLSDLWFLCEDCHNELHRRLSKYMKKNHKYISYSIQEQKRIKKKLIKLHKPQNQHKDKLTTKLNKKPKVNVHSNNIIVYKPSHNINLETHNPITIKGQIYLYNNLCRKLCKKPIKLKTMREYEEANKEMQRLLQVIKTDNL